MSTLWQLIKVCLRDGVDAIRLVEQNATEHDTYNIFVWCTSRDRNRNLSSRRKLILCAKTNEVSRDIARVRCIMTQWNDWWASSQCSATVRPSDILSVIGYADCHLSALRCIPACLAALLHDPHYRAQRRRRLKSRMGKKLQFFDRRHYGCSKFESLL